MEQHGKNYVVGRRHQYCCSRVSNRRKWWFAQFSYYGWMTMDGLCQDRNFGFWMVASVWMNPTQRAPVHRRPSGSLDIWWRRILSSSAHENRKYERRIEVASGV